LWRTLWFMSSGTLISIVIGVLVLAVVVVRQLSVRRLRENYRLSIILGIIGIVEFVNFLKAHTTGETHIVEAVAGSLVLAAVLAVPRALTVRIWRQGDQLMIRGGWLTAALWVIAVALHYGYDYLVAGSGKDGDNVGSATVLLYLVVSLTVQRFIMLTRAQRLTASGQMEARPAGPGATIGTGWPPSRAGRDGQL
jgi:energy-coupling factor transporter transmembrane protein EcfT